MRAQSPRVAILGANGLIGKALYRGLSQQFIVKGFTREDADFSNFAETVRLISSYKPDLIINASGKVGGVAENLKSPVELLISNISSSINILRAAHECNVPRLFQFGSACMYPLKDSGGSREDELGTGSVEESSRAYAHAKILQHEALYAYHKEYNRSDWITLVPTNLFGAQDWEHGQSGHFIGMMTEKVLRAKKNRKEDVEVWGDGTALRDFISVEDLVSTLSFLIVNGTNGESIINISGYGEISVREIAIKLKSITGYDGELVFNAKEPSGAKRKLLDASLLKGLGWNLTGNLHDALESYVNLAELHFLSET
jgi:GDP-L-fucose synthase